MFRNPNTVGVVFILAMLFQILAIVYMSGVVREVSFVVREKLYYKTTVVCKMEEPSNAETSSDVPRVRHGNLAY